MPAVPTEVTDADVLTFFVRIFGDEWAAISNRRQFLRLQVIANRWDCDLIRAENRPGYFIGWLLPGCQPHWPPEWYETYAKTLDDVVKLLLQRKRGLKTKPAEFKVRKNVRTPDGGYRRRGEHVAGEQ